MMTKRGRREKNRHRVTVMVDRRLWDRVKTLAKQYNGNKSEALNVMLWAGVFGKLNMAEKYEFEKKFDKLTELCKSFIENGL